MTSFVGASIAIVETSNIIDHQLHLEFPLVEVALVGLLITFIIGLFITYRNQKTPDRIKEKIKNKFEKWSATQSVQFKLNTTELLNANLFPELLSENNFDKFIEISKQNNSDGGAMNKLLPILNILLLVGFLGAGIFFYVKLGKASNTIEKELPEFLQLIKEGKSGAAYYAGKKILDNDPNNKVVIDGLKSITTTVDLMTVSPNIEVYLQLSEADNKWEFVGKTPINKTSLPNGTVKLKFVDTNKNEFIVSAGTYFISTGENVFELPASMPDTSTMALVIGGKTNIFLAGLDSRPAAKFSPYLIDKNEVTNEEYKKFVDAGGYKNASLWTIPATLNGKPFNFEFVQKFFVDKTGFLGPATWSNGSFPDGKAKFPVNGISWYEADAYAKFMKKNLPSVHQWAKAATPSRSGLVCPVSNFSKSETKEVPYSTIKSGYGLSDVAGNVREWCANATKDDLTERAILGGGYDDDPYTFNDYYGQDAFSRSSSNGVRLVKDLTNNNLPLYAEVIKKPFRDFLKLPKISKEIFEIYKRQFDYEAGPLDIKILKTDNSDPDYTYELIEYNAAYNNERMSGVLFKPKNVTGKAQAIIHFPGSNVIHTSEIEKVTLGQMARSYLKMGYAFFYPIYKGTINRQDALKSDYADKTDLYKDHVIMWGKDMKRSIDVIESRSDLDVSNLIYFGVSWGGEMANIMIPIEPRIKRAVLLVAGLEFEEAKPEVEAASYTPFIKVPILMLNGKYDYFFPSETSQKPMFELIGTNK
ncbi:MAG: SUMF1/EgtB/PvdO family nonheme iron enzyme, partial [Chitinophagaceae bacterium]